MVPSARSRLLQSQMHRLERAELIHLAANQPDIAYIFRHALVQESAYATLVRADRQRTHRAVGETLEQLYAGAEPPSEVVLQLARHFEEAGDDARAVSYYRRAGDAALAGYANVEAVAAFTRALACAERSLPGADWQHLFTARGRALELNSQFAEALANYETMASRAEAHGDRRLALAAAVARGQLYATATPLFDPPRAERMAEAALAEAHALGDETAEAHILWNQLNLYRFSQRNPQARSSGEASLALAQRLGLKEQAALTLNDLIHVYADLGQWPEAEAASREASSLWRELGNSAMLADSLSTTASYGGLLAEFDSAIRQGREALEISRRIGNLWGQSYSLSALSQSYWYTGQPDLAIQTCEECTRLGQAAGYLVALVFDRARLAFMYGELGDRTHGLELVHQALHATAFVGGVGIGVSYWVKAHLELALGHTEAAVSAQRELESKLYGPPIWEIDPIFRAQAEVALAQGEAARALDLAQAHLEHLRALGLKVFVAETLGLSAQALFRLGRASEARRTLLEALGREETRRSVIIEWPLRYRLGQLELAQGEAAAAEPQRARARELVLEVAARVPTPELRQSFLARPDVRALFGAAPAGGRHQPSAEPAL